MSRFTVVAVTAALASAGPCDIYAAAGTPCVAAHAVTRALFDAYSGPLYAVNRSSDKTLADIGVVAPGGVANAAAQDAFCMGTQCTIWRIYDQVSPRRHSLCGAWVACARDPPAPAAAPTPRVHHRP